MPTPTISTSFMNGTLRSARRSAAIFQIDSFQLREIQIEPILNVTKIWKSVKGLVSRRGEDQRRDEAPGRGLLLLLKGHDCAPFYRRLRDSGLKTIGLRDPIPRLSRSRNPRWVRQGLPNGPSSRGFKRRGALTASSVLDVRAVRRSHARNIDRASEEIFRRGEGSLPGSPKMRETFS